MKKHYRNRVNVMLLLAALLLGSSCSKPDDAQTAPAASADDAGVQRENPAEPNAPDGVLSAVESLAAPIALYPDPLLAEVLIAATYPPEIALAARRLESGSTPQAAGSRDLDAGIARLERLPPVIIMLNEHPQWTAALGDAFLAQPEALLQAIQTLRQRAAQAGFLKDSAAQKVVKKTVSTAPGAEKPVREIIIILPAEPPKIHVPLYAPETVFSTSLAVQPATSGKRASAQQLSSDDARAGVLGDYYPAYYPLSSESGDTGNTTMAFGAGTVVDGLLTWGHIEWGHEDGYYIHHRYGKLAACNSRDDCWLRSGDKGYRYTNEFVDSADKAAVSSWHHDPRHRRGFRYSEEAVKRQGDLGPPPLAGQRLSAPALPLRDRGFDVALPVDDTEEENSTAVDHLFPAARDSVLSGISEVPKNGGDEVSKRGGERRNRNKAAAAPKQGVVRVLDVHRSGSKSPVKQAAQLEALHALQMQQRLREAALPSAFDGIGDNARLTGRFSLRGAASRNNKLLSD